MLVYIFIGLAAYLAFGAGFSAQIAYDEGRDDGRYQHPEPTKFRLQLSFWAIALLWLPMIIIVIVRELMSRRG